MSREKEKAVPRMREKLRAWPWLASVCQKARHWVTREEDTSSHILAVDIFDYLKIRYSSGRAAEVMLLSNPAVSGTGLTKQKVKSILEPLNTLCKPN